MIVTRFAAVEGDPETLEGWQ